MTVSLPTLQIWPVLSSILAELVLLTSAIFVCLFYYCIWARNFETVTSKHLFLTVYTSFASINLVQYVEQSFCVLNYIWVNIYIWHIYIIYFMYAKYLICISEIN